MTALNIKPADRCKYDLLSLGGIMLRRCFGMRTAVATVFADNNVCRVIRKGLNFTERSYDVQRAGATLIFLILSVGNCRIL